MRARLRFYPPYPERLRVSMRFGEDLGGEFFANEAMRVMKRILVVLTALLLVGPTAAEATDPPGTYVVSSCQLGDQPIPLVGWFRESANDPHLLDSCGTRNGSFGASPNGQLGWASGERYRWLWNAPADTAVSGVRVWGVSGSAPGRFGLIGGWFSAGDVTIDLPGGIRPTENLAVNTTQLSLAVGCGGLEGCLSRDEAPPSGGSSRPAGVTVSRMEILLRDVVPPEAVSPPTGTLLNGEPLTGTVGVGTSYRDRGGGVQSLALLIDGVQVTQRLITSGSCRQPSAVAVPCPLSGRLDLDFDTSSISDGPHRAELELRDVAGIARSLGRIRLLFGTSRRPPRL